MNQRLGPVGWRSARPPDLPQQMWDQTLAGQAEKMNDALKKAGREILKALPRWMRRLFVRRWGR